VNGNGWIGTGAIRGVTGRSPKLAAMDVLAIVQARGGSKGVPRKNLAAIAGHPLVAYSVAAALDAASVTRVICSTDDDEIAAAATRYGAECPFRRPADLADDAATDFPLFAHALGWLKANEDYRPGVVVQLRPTSPFRPRGLIDQAVARLLADDRADCVRGVVRAHATPYKMWRRYADEGPLRPLLPAPPGPDGQPIAEPYNAPRQRLPPVWFQTGHVDAIRATTITDKGSLTGDRVLGIEVQRRYCVDIDAREDLDLAELALRRRDLDIAVPAPREP